MLPKSLANATYVVKKLFRESGWLGAISVRDAWMKSAAQMLIIPGTDTLFPN
jgi:hypothetical protein